MYRFLVLIPFIMSTAFAQSEGSPPLEKLYVPGEMLLSYEVKAKSQLKITPQKAIADSLTKIQGKRVKILPVHPQPENSKLSLSNKLLVKIDRSKSVPLIIKKLKTDKTLSQQGIKILVASPNYIIQNKPRITSLTTAQSIIAAMRKGERVITVKSALPFLDEGYREELEIAELNDIIIVAPAGDKKSKSKYYPAALKNIISVAAALSTFDLSVNTNYGNWISLAAPTENDKEVSSFLAADKVTEALKELCKVEGQCSRDKALARLLEASVPAKSSKKTSIKVLDIKRFISGLKKPSLNFAAMDINQDGYVNREDLMLLKSKLGSKVAAGAVGDINQDGVIDQSDYDTLEEEIEKREVAEVRGFNISLSSNLLLDEKYDLNGVIQAYLTDGTIHPLKASEVTWISSNPSVATLNGEKIDARSPGTTELTAHINFRGTAETLKSTLTVFSAETFPRGQENSVLRFSVSDASGMLKRTCFPALGYMLETDDNGSLLLRRYSYEQHIDYDQEKLNAKWQVDVSPVTLPEDNYSIYFFGTMLALSEDKNTAWVFAGVHDYDSEDYASEVNAIIRVDISNPSTPKIIDKKLTSDYDFEELYYSNAHFTKDKIHLLSYDIARDNQNVTLTTYNLSTASVARTVTSIDTQGWKILSNDGLNLITSKASETKEVHKYLDLHAYTFRFKIMLNQIFVPGESQMMHILPTEIKDEEVVTHKKLEINLSRIEDDGSFQVGRNLEKAEWSQKPYEIYYYTMETITVPPPKETCKRYIKHTAEVYLARTFADPEVEVLSFTNTNSKPEYVIDISPASYNMEAFEIEWGEGDGHWDRYDPNLPGGDVVCEDYFTDGVQLFPSNSKINLATEHGSFSVTPTSRPFSYYDRVSIPERRLSSVVNGKRLFGLFYELGSADLYDMVKLQREQRIPVELHRAPDQTLIAKDIDRNILGYSSGGEFLWKLDVPLYTKPIFLENGIIVLQIPSWTASIISQVKDINPTYELSSHFNWSESPRYSLAFTDTAGTFFLPAYKQIESPSLEGPGDLRLEVIEGYSRFLDIETRIQDDFLPTINHINLIRTESQSCSNGVCTK